MRWLRLSRSGGQNRPVSCLETGYELPVFRRMFILFSGNYAREAGLDPPTHPQSYLTRFFGGGLWVPIFWMVWGWFGDGLGMVWGWFADGLGMVLERICRGCRGRGAGGCNPRPPFVGELLAEPHVAAGEVLATRGHRLQGIWMMFGGCW